MAQQPGLGQAEDKFQELSLTWVSGAPTLGLSSAAFPGLQQEAGSLVAQLWDAGITGCGFTIYATMPAPKFFLRGSSTSHSLGPY